MTAPEPPSAADWRRVLDLLRGAGLPTADLDGAHRDRFLVVRDGGDVVGCVAVEPYGAAGLLRSLAVAADARGRGLGARLVEAAEAKARTDGLRTLHLLTTTAASFFEARGYAFVDRGDVPDAVRQSAEFKGVCPSSAVCMGKLLSPPR
jgi:amino-acid N-acetyltransferase